MKILLVNKIRRIGSEIFCLSTQSLTQKKYILSATWILIPYLIVIALLIVMAIRMYMINSRRFRLNKNLTKYIATVHDMQKNLEQLNQSLNDVSVNNGLEEPIHDKIRLAIWRINSMQATLNNLVGLENDTTWIQNQQSYTSDTMQRVQTEQPTLTNNTSLAGTNSSNNNDQFFLEKVFSIIRENYVNPDFNVDHLSQKMGMSRSSFFNKIKAISGQAPADFIRQYRIERAKELLRTKEYTISEVAFKSGFSDVKYFRDVFRKKYNQSPSQYAKSN